MCLMLRMRMFLFHTGSIKSYIQTRKIEDISVSIPYWFD